MDVTYNKYQRTSTVRCGDVHYHILWAWPELVRDANGIFWEYY